MPDITQEQFVDYIKSISVLELAELVKTLEDELGVKAAAAVPILPYRRWQAHRQVHRRGTACRRSHRQAAPVLRMNRRRALPALVKRDGP